MQNYVGIFRNEEDLKKGLGEIELNERAARVRVEGSRLFNPGWHLARDLKSMLTVSEAVALSARRAKRAGARTVGSTIPTTTKRGASRTTSSTRQATR